MISEVAFCSRSGSTDISRFDVDSYGGSKKTLMVACTNYTIEKEDSYMRYPSNTVFSLQGDHSQR